MEEKTFELLEKMYVEFSKRLENQDKKLDSIGNELKEIKQKQIKMDIKIEQTIEPKLQSLHEAKDIIYDRLDKIEDKIDTIASRMERQEVEIKVMRGGN